MVSRVLTPTLISLITLYRTLYFNVKLNLTIHILILVHPSNLSGQAVCAVGMFELQIRHFQNPLGVLLSGDCCDLQASGSSQHCSARDQCDTYFQACLKEYQARVNPTGACTFGSGSTGILGGNSQSFRHRGHVAGGGGGGGEGGEDGANGHIVIPFKYAWPVSTGVGAGYSYGNQGNWLNNTVKLRLGRNNNGGMVSHASTLLSVARFIYFLHHHAGPNTALAV